MFDPVTAALLRSAPALPGLDPAGIPQLLTRHYADLVSARLRGADAATGGRAEWPLERIADTYELITSIHNDPAIRRASAFVAGTAQQILARRRLGRQLKAHPVAIWGLQHNWLVERRVHCSFTPLLDEPVSLAGNIKHGRLRIAPNANEVSAAIAVGAARNDLKTIVFVNTKADSASTARKIARQLDGKVAPSKDEQSRWDALRLELGDLKHFRLERDLAERMFRRPDGATVIVATPTLAQGLNLPAHLAVLAGDKRAAKGGGREDLEAHEILNAAARAGRAGHLANGAVLLVPEPIIGFASGKSLAPEVVEKLGTVLPEDDRCVEISDPLEVVLDRLMKGQALDPDVRYTINRMALLRGSDDDSKPPATMFNLDRSLAAYAAKQGAREKEFNEKVKTLKLAVEDELMFETDESVFVLASKSGLPAGVLVRLKERASKKAGKLPTTIVGWIEWTFEWLRKDDDARRLLLEDVARAARAATGGKKDGEVGADTLNSLLPGIKAWISGKPIADIEIALGGNPNAASDSQRICPRARELVGTVIPRAFSFILSIVSYVVTELDPFDAQKELSRELVESLGTAVRLGYNSVEKLTFATQNASLLSRVQVHRAWVAQESYGTHRP